MHGHKFRDGAMTSGCHYSREEKKQFCGSTNMTRLLSEAIFTPLNSIISTVDYKISSAVFTISSADYKNNNAD